MDCARANFESVANKGYELNYKTISELGLKKMK